MSGGQLAKLSLAIVSALVMLSACGLEPRSTAEATPGFVAPSTSPVATFSYPAAACLFTKADTPVDALSWLEANAIPLGSTSPGSPSEDLSPLKRLIGDARIVALGDESHGIHEFFQMKLRLIEFLVEEMGFNAVAIEVPSPQATLVDAYVRGQDGDPLQLLYGLGNWWSYSEEMVDTLAWMRRYNEDKAQSAQVRFAGFDLPWANPRVGIDSVLGYLRKADADAAGSADSLYQCFLANQDYMQYRKSAQATKSMCLANLRQVVSLLESNKPAFVASTSASEFAAAFHSAEVVLQAGLFDFASPSDVWADRDQFMADEVAWLLEQYGPTSKIVLWAHNGHVGTITDGAYVSMGTRLRQRYGPSYFVIGFGFYSGSVNVASLNNPYTVMSPPPDSYEALFHSSTNPDFILDLRSPDLPPDVADWLRGPHCTHSIGTSYDDTTPQRYFDPAYLPAWFDAFLYIDQVTPTTLLPLP